jgi:ABC-type transporter Mla MlaB component
MTRDPATAASLVLEGALTIRTSEATYRSLRQAVGEHASVEIDAQGAEEIDLSFIQILLAAHKSAQAASRTVCLAGPANGSLLDTLTRAGFVPVSTDPGQPDPTQAKEFWFEAAGA